MCRIPEIQVLTQIGTNEFFFSLFTNLIIFQSAAIVPSQKHQVCMKMFWPKLGKSLFKLYSVHFLDRSRTHVPENQISITQHITNT